MDGSRKENGGTAVPEWVRDLMLGIAGGAVPAVGAFVFWLIQRRVALRDAPALSAADEAARHAYRLREAVADRRFEAHQKAFRYVALLRNHMNAQDTAGKESLIGLVMECQNWWEENCLYLDDEPRKAFQAAYNSAFQRPELFAAPRNDETKALLQSTAADIFGAFQAIERAVALRPYAAEIKPIKRDPENS